MMLNNKRVIELNESGMNAYMAIYNGMTATGGIVLTVGGSRLTEKTIRHPRPIACSRLTAE
jgi:hypothetical protein